MGTLDNLMAMSYMMKALKPPKVTLHVHPSRYQTLRDALVKNNVEIEQAANLLTPSPLMGMRVIVDPLVPLTQKRRVRRWAPRRNRWYNRPKYRITEEPIIGWLFEDGALMKGIGYQR